MLVFVMMSHSRKKMIMQIHKLKRNKASITRLRVSKTKSHTRILNLSIMIVTYLVTHLEVNKHKFFKGLVDQVRFKMKKTSFLVSDLQNKNRFLKKKNSRVHPSLGQICKIISNQYLEKPKKAPFSKNQGFKSWKKRRKLKRLSTNPFRQKRPLRSSVFQNNSQI